MVFSWKDRIAQILLGYSFGRLAAIGAAAFVVITLLALLGLFSGVTAASVVIVIVALAAALVTLFVPGARAFGIGFFAMLLITTVFERDFTTLWWVTLRGLFSGTAAPYQRSAEARAKLSEWLAVRKGRPLRLEAARDLLERLSGRDCIGLFFPPESIPATERDLIAESGCSSDRYFVLGGRDGRGVLYGPEDQGWRWTYERLPTQTRLGRPNYRLLARPDPLLEVAGPIVERDGDGRLLIRETDKAPLQTLSTPIPMMKRFRECVTIAADSARPSDLRRWTSLPESGAMRRACKNWRLSASGTATGGDIVYEVRWFPPSNSPRINDHLILYHVLSPGRFEIRSRWGMRHYLLDSDGGLHLTTEDREADANDGPPDACELDIAITCEPAV